MINALCYALFTLAGIAAIVSLADSLVRAWHFWSDLDEN